MPLPAGCVKKCTLAKHMNDSQICALLKPYEHNIRSYEKEQTVAFEGEECSNIGIVIEGSVEVRKIFASGRTVTIERLCEGDIFGEVIIFSDMGHYPSTIVSTDKTKILFIDKHDIIEICKTNEQFLQGFMRLLSNKILLLNRKIKSLSYQTIRQKVANYILEEMRNQKSTKLQLSYSRKEMADILGIPRPSLSRELAKMSEEGMIEFNKSIIIVKDEEALEDCLLE